MRMLAPDAPEDALRGLTTMLDVPIPEAAERIHRLRQLGISYFTFSKTEGTSRATFEKLINRVGRPR